MLKFKNPYEKDIEKITDKKLAEQVASVIQELENCKAIAEIRSVKKMKAKGLYFRIRIGNYRLGLSQNQNTVTLLRFMHRKDIYTYFP